VIFAIRGRWAYFTTKIVRVNPQDWSEMRSAYWRPGLPHGEEDLAVGPGIHPNYMGSTGLLYHKGG